MTSKDRGYAREKKSSIQPGVERAAQRRAKYHLAQTLRDFVDWLRARPETVSFGIGAESIPPQPLIEEYIADQGLEGHEPGASKPNRISILGRRYGDLKAEIAAMESTEALQALSREAEAGKNRIAVLKAISDRLAELADDGV